MGVFPTSLLCTIRMLDAIFREVGPIRIEVLLTARPISGQLRGSPKR